MLLELTIKDFAIIDELSLNFRDGFTVITGETGAGKSILIDAVNLVLGSHADRDFVRAGAQKAIVDATFGIPQVLRTEVQSILDDADIDYDTVDEVTMSREVRANGRSTARINGSAIRVSVYQELGSILLDIHGQSENQKLLQPKQHIYLLDSFADLTETRAALKTLVRRLQKIRREIKNLEKDDAAIARRVDILEYQIQEIDAAKLKVGEEEDLMEESDLLAKGQKLLNFANEVNYLMSDSDAEHVGVLPQLNEAVLIISKLAALDSSLQEYEELANSLSMQAEVLSDAINDYGESLDLSPERINAVEERLAAIKALTRKYGGDIEAVLEFADKAREELKNITNSEQRLEELRQQELDFLHQIGDMGRALSGSRKTAAERLSKLIEAQLKTLRMENARFEVSIEQHEDDDGCFVGDKRIAFDQTGIDDVNFMLSTNFGEPLKPLAKVASGGETSRSMLALKTVLTKADNTPTMIFDEVDQGIGGRLGMVIGEKLWRLSKNHQVLVVTHLAQLAAFADNHIHVSKGVTGKRTTTHVQLLAEKNSLEELTEMLGSETDSARQNAEDLVKLAAEVESGKVIATS